MNRAFIDNKIATDDAWLYRGVVAIFNRQTKDEQKVKGVKYRNAQGFTPADANFLSSIAVLIKAGCPLSEKQLFVTRKRMQKYGGQLLRIATANEKAKRDKLLMETYIARVTGETA